MNAEVLIEQAADLLRRRHAVELDGEIAERVIEKEAVIDAEIEHQRRAVCKEADIHAVQEHRADIGHALVGKFFRAPHDLEVEAGYSGIDREVEFQHRGVGRNFKESELAENRVEIRIARETRRSGRRRLRVAGVRRAVAAA